MTAKEQFVRESDQIRLVMMKTLGENYEQEMAKLAIEIVEHQHLVGLNTSLSAAISLCKCYEVEGRRTDRIRAAYVWWQCNKLYFCNALYNLMDEK